MSVNLGNDTKATSPVRTPDEAKESKYEPKQNKKLVRLLTVIAYVISVSMAAIILSLYYVFLWDPQLKYPAKVDRTPTMDTTHFSVPGTGETRMEAADSLMESDPTPRALPLQENNNNHYYQHNAHQPYDGQTTATQSISNNNHQSSLGPSPHQSLNRDTSPTGSPYVSDELRQQQQQQQQHGQPQLSASA